MVNRERYVRGPRRKLLKVMVAGSGAVFAGKLLPEKWVRPLVESAVLPAHAQATGASFGGSGLAVAEAGEGFGARRYAEGRVQRLLEAVVPAAHAIPAPTATACAVVSGNLMDVTLQRSQNNTRRQGLLDLIGTIGTLTVIAQSHACAGKNILDLDARITNYTALGFTLQFRQGGTADPWINLDVPAGICPGFDPLDGDCPNTY